MNRYLARTLAAVALVGPALTGCNLYRNWVDPCWPQRYNNTARKEVIDAFAPQVQNGQVLDQTVWNSWFVNGTDELNGLGMSKLDYIVRRRPAPDPNIFIQTAHDVAYDAADPDKLADARRELDMKRITAVQRYLNAQTVGRPMQFDYAIHDPFPVGAHSAKVAGDLRLATTPTTTGVLGSISGGDSGLGSTSAPGQPSGFGTSGNTGMPGAPGASGASGAQGVQGRRKAPAEA